MKSKQILAFVLPWAVILSTSSCIREVSLDTMEKRPVVVECVLVNEPVQSLRLCFGQGASEQELTYIYDAEAVLTDLTTGSGVGRFSRTSDGIWNLSYSVIPGHSYRLDVSVPGYDPIYAEQTIPEIDVSAAFYALQFGDSSSYEYDSAPYIVYHLKSLPEYTWIYALRYDDSLCGRTIAEEICTDYPFVDNFNLTGGTYTPETHIKTMMGIPIEVALAPDLIGKSIHNRYLRIPHPSELDKMWLIVSGNFSGDFPIRFVNDNFAGPLVDDGKLLELGEKQGCVVFSGVSEDYDRYLRESIRYQQLQESSDLSSIYVRDNIYTNIHGGIGIMGAKVEEKMVWCNEEGVLNSALPFTSPNHLHQ